MGVAAGLPGRGKCSLGITAKVSTAWFLSLRCCVSRQCRSRGWRHSLAVVVVRVSRGFWDGLPVLSILCSYACLVGSSKWLNSVFLCLNIRTTLFCSVIVVWYIFVGRYIICRRVFHSHFILVMLGESKAMFARIAVRLF